MNYSKLLLVYANKKTRGHGRKMLDEYFRQYGVIAVFAALAVAVPTGMLLLSWLLSNFGLRPKNPSSIKNSIYECGFETISDKWSNFNFRYYSIALLFVIFDVETIFLLPWAIQYGVLGLFGFIEVLVFLAILIVGYIWIFKQGELKWV